ncbi:TfuA-like protein [Spongiactinospora sp. TRM90649]|uniref:TfuA-like protein n=1 Tax=Spongiactinospora sp. TRM90649 TaxID=3031114 RepID=UPI0023F84B49|nr:TfuA-like protein [Spongiactinospora sp. TRM90649]MDF5759111.1 TfuA-like protein [Spongiactinospora sp. TRM90649]
MRTVVYAGPTITPPEIRAVVPEAEVRPPVSRGDLLREDWNPGDTAVVIDGYYRERLSVGHKEIIWLLGEGVDVIGAASMGALRAAELGPYGMRGVGSVYRMYATGEVDGDDEVAILHGPAAMGYPAGTVAMVNIRHGCREGARAGLVPEAAGERIVRAAKARPFSHRTWPELARALDGDVRDCLATLERMIGAGVWDLKRLDALAALDAVGDRVDRVDRVDREPGRTPSALTGITHQELLKWRSTREYAPGRWMSALDVLNAARLFGRDYPSVHEEVLSGLLRESAEELSLTPEAYARASLGVPSGAALPSALSFWLTEAEAAESPVAERLRPVMVRVWPVWQSADWRPAVIERLRDSPDWQEWSDLVVRADEATDQARGRLVVPPPEICARLFLRHWRRDGSSAEVEMARRGFFGLEELGRAVGRFFALDVRNGRGPR